MVAGTAFAVVGLTVVAEGGAVVTAAVAAPGPPLVPVPPAPPPTLVGPAPAPAPFVPGVATAALVVGVERAGRPLAPEVAEPVVVVVVAVAVRTFDGWAWTPGSRPRSPRGPWSPADR